MRMLLATAIAVLTTFTSIAQAEDAVGYVRGLYIQVTRGVLVERSVIPTDADRWADVEITSSAGGTRRILAKVPSTITTAVGDLVEVELTSKALATVTAPLPRTNLITAVRHPVLSDRTGLSNLPDSNLHHARP
jgi:hypothetical protein